MLYIYITYNFACIYIAQYIQIKYVNMCVYIHFNLKNIYKEELQNSCEQLK